MAWVDHGPVEPGRALAEARIAILGAGVTGTAVKRALVAHGVGSRVEILAPSGGDAVVSDDDAALARWLGGFDVLVASPGVPPRRGSRSGASRSWRGGCGWPTRRPASRRRGSP